MTVWLGEAWRWHHQDAVGENVCLWRGLAVGTNGKGQEGEGAPPCYQGRW